ncbi:MAG: SPOR domain-containing protein [Pseudomonadota bacterium]|nr:SPOR domain-containing protein [Pseudomonadota bacterium]
MNARPRPDIEPDIGETPDVLDTQHPDAELRADPFSDGWVEGLFFPGAGRQEALEQLAHLLRYGPSLLVLHGDQGVGKHFLVDHVLAELDMDLFDVALVQADVMMNPAQILGALSSPWHVREGFRLDSLQAQVIDCATVADNESRTLLLVVRHSQFLDETCSQLLSLVLASGAGLPLKVLLVMDEDDPDALQQFATLFDQVPDHFRLALAPFGQQETEDYLTYRMRTGGMGQVRFSAEQMERIFNMSLGNASRINRVASELLQAAISHKQSKGAGVRVPWLHVGALGAVVLLLLVLMLTRTDPEPETVRVSPLEQPVVESQAEQDAPKVASLSQADSTESAPTAGQPEAGREAAPVQSAKVNPEPAAAPAPEAVAMVAPEPVPQPAAKPAPKAAPEARPAPKPKPVAETKRDSRTAWILSLPAEHYAIQLLGAKERATVDKFLAAYPSVQKLTYYKTQRNGAPWYVVVQASYPSYDAAKSAVGKLPQNLQKQGPWIRKIEAIQKDLKN